MPALTIENRQTEAGTIPTDWEVDELQSVCRHPITYGIVQCGPHVDNGVPYIRVSDMSSPQLDVTTMLRTSAKLAAGFARSTVRAGEIVYALRGLIGHVHLIPRDADGANLTQGTARVSPSERVDSQFLFWALRSSASLRQANMEAKGSTFREITLAEIRKVEVPIPPLDEQRAIAEALGDVDALLGVLSRMLTKKRDLKQAAMQQLLTGQTRLPGFKGEWEEKKIGPDIDLLTGYPFPSTKYTESGIRLLRGSNVKRGRTDWSEDLIQCWPEVTASVRHYELRSGDLVIAMDGSLVGRSYARLADSDLPALLLQRVARIRSSVIDIGYLTQHVGSDYFVKYCDSVKTVTAIPHISPGDIRNFRVPLPPTLAEQTAIAEVLSDMDAEIAALERRREKTQLLKQGMMQELLTGKTRLV